MIQNMDKRKTRSHPGERVLFMTRPRFFANTKSTIIKLLIILLIIYIYGGIVANVTYIQNYLQQTQAFSLPLIFVTVYLMLFVIVILLLWAMVDVIAWRQKKYQLTNYRVIVEKGIIRKKRNYIHFQKIQDVNISQGLWNRIFFSGDIEIYGGHERTSIILEDIPNPSKVEETINSLIEVESVGVDDYSNETPMETPKEAPKKVSEKKEVHRSIMDEHGKKFRR
jgi:uncharacterized membrane protein YdbT with pleckstrin-like domain